MAAPIRPGMQAIPNTTEQHQCHTYARIGCSHDAHALCSHRKLLRRPQVQCLAACVMQASCRCMHVQGIRYSTP